MRFRRLVRVQVSKIEAGCMALEQAAIGMPSDPVPADLQGALAMPDIAFLDASALPDVAFQHVCPARGRCRSGTLCSLLPCTLVDSKWDVQKAFARAAGLLRPCLAHLPAPPKPRHAEPQTVAQAVAACLHARMALLRSLGRHAPDSPQVAPCVACC